MRNYRSHVSVRSHQSLVIVPEMAAACIASIELHTEEKDHCTESLNNVRAVDPKAEFILESKAFHIAFSHVLFRFWGHKRLSNNPSRYTLARPQTTTMSKSRRCAACVGVSRLRRGPSEGLLSDWSTSKCYLKINVAPWAEKSSALRAFTLMTHDSIGQLQMLCMSFFYRWAVALSLNGNNTAHCSASKKC